jgi:hypothetical protein
VARSEIDAIAAGRDEELYFAPNPRWHINHLMCVCACVCACVCVCVRACVLLECRVSPARVNRDLVTYASLRSAGALAGKSGVGWEACSPTSRAAQSEGEQAPLAER